MFIKRVIHKLPVRYKWTIHNMIAHPLMEILHQLNFSKLSEYVHDITIPEEEVNDKQST